MTQLSAETFTATIYVGRKRRLTGEVIDPYWAIAEVQEYIDQVGFCVSIKPCDFLYTSGQEPGLEIGIINYPRFPMTPEGLKERTVAIAEILMVRLRQLTVSIVMPNETILLKREPGEE